jgi:hypothetical protein
MVSGQIGGVNTAWECLQYLETHHEYSVLAIALSLYSDFQRQRSADTPCEPEHMIRHHYCRRD